MNRPNWTLSQDEIRRTTLRVEHRLSRRELACIVAWMRDHYGLVPADPADFIREQVKQHLLSYGQSELMDAPEPEPTDYEAVDRAFPGGLT